MPVHTPSLFFPLSPSPFPLPPVASIKFTSIGWVWRLGPDCSHSYPFPINYLIVSSLLSLSFSLLWHSTNTTPAHPAIRYTTSPHSPTILTIFYILYRPSLKASVFCFLVSFDFELCKMWMLPSFTLYQYCLSFVRFLLVLSHDFLCRVYF